MSGDGSPTCRPGSVHPRRPRGSLVGLGEKGRSYLKRLSSGLFSRPDWPPLGLRGWDQYSLRGRRKKGRERGSEKSTPLSPTPTPFSLFPYPLPLSTPATQARISTTIKTCRKYEAVNWSLRQGKSKQKNKTKNIYLNKLPNISVWKQTFFRGLKNTLLHRRRGCKFKCIIVPSIQKPLSVGFSTSFFLRLPSFHLCP